jgi:hypothetical protein
MSDPNIDSLSGQNVQSQPQPQSDQPVQQPQDGPIISTAGYPEVAAEHIQMPPIGPTNILDSLAAQPQVPQMPPQPTVQPPEAGPPRPIDPNIATAVINPVVETHKGTVPIPPVAGSGVVPVVPPKPAGAVSNVDTPWAQRPVYLWLLLLIGIIFLFILFLVYFGGIYKAQ